MRLTDSTEVRLICGGTRIAVTEGKAPAVILPLSEAFPCGDYYEGAPAFTNDADYDGDWFPDSPSDLIQTCTALRVGFDNGSACVAGHRHFTDAEYYDREEAEGLLRDGFLLAANARLCGAHR